MTTYTLTLPLTKNENNSYIEANSITIDINDANVSNIVSAIRNMPKAANQTRIALDGNIEWLLNGKETDDRISMEEIIVFKDGDLYIVGTEKYNCIEIESNSFKIDEVNDMLLGYKENTYYCEICCMETTFDEQDNCEVCGNPKSAELSEKDEEIENLAFENKNMALALSGLGFTQEQIGAICNGSFGMLKAWIDVENSIEEVDYVVNVVILDIVSSKNLSEIHEYHLRTEKKANAFVEKINNSKLLTLNDAIFVYNEIKDDEENSIVLR